VAGAEALRSPGSRPTAGDVKLPLRAARLGGGSRGFEDSAPATPSWLLEQEVP
jgi:hypothetical protein